MKQLKEYIQQIYQLKNEITTCNNLVDFYKKKKKDLEAELKRLEELQMVEAVPVEVKAEIK